MAETEIQTHGEDSYTQHQRTLENLLVEKAQLEKECHETYLTIKNQESLLDDQRTMDNAERLLKEKLDQLEIERDHKAK